MADLSMSLKAAQINPTAFVPTQYEFQPTDMSFLERSLAKKEARIQQTVEQQSAIDQALGAIELQLNSKEANWFNRYKQNIKNQIQEQIDAGDYGNAIRTATKLAGNIASDPRILSRIESQRNYLKAYESNRLRVEKGEIDAAALRWWDSIHGYNYEDKKDENNNYVKGNIWNATPLLNRLNADSEILLSYKLINPDRISNDTNINSSYKLEQVTENDIRNNLKSRYNSSEQLRAQVEQSLEVEKFRLKELEDALNIATDDTEKNNITNEINDINNRIKKNGAFVNGEKYFENIVLNSNVVSNLAYRHASEYNIYSSLTNGTTTPRNTNSVFTNWTTANSLLIDEGPIIEIEGTQDVEVAQTASNILRFHNNNH